MTQTINIEDLRADHLNLNKGTHQGDALMEKSMSRLKAGRSILIDKDGNIIAGNKTAEIAKRLGYKNVRVIESDGTELIAVKRIDMDIDSKEGREMALADNATAVVNLAWDEENLAVFEDNYGIDPSSWCVDLEKNTPSYESKGEVDVSDFDINQTLKIKLTSLQYEAVITKLTDTNTDIAEALLTILGYYA